MRRRRYSGYHGPSGARNVLKGIAVLLVIVLVLVLTGLFIGQRYLVYTDDGVRLELPFFQREQTPPDASVPVNIVQLPGKPAPEPEPPEGAPGQVGSDSLAEEENPLS